MQIKTLSSVSPMTKFATFSLTTSITLASFVLLAISPTQRALASSCDCQEDPIPIISIDDFNTLHSSQSTLKPIDAYYQLEDKKGKVLVDKLYEIRTYPDGRILAKRDGQFGIINTTGKVILDFAYDGIEVLNSDLYKLTEYLGSKQATAVVDGSGKWLYPKNSNFNKEIQVTPLYFDKTNDISYFSVLKNGKYGLINDNHQTLLPLIYDELELTDTGLNDRLFMTVKLGSKTALIDQYQKFVVPLTKNIGISKFNSEQQIFSIKNLLPNADFTGKYTDNQEVIAETLINGKGIKLIESEAVISYLEGNLHMFKRAGKFGIINDNVEMALPPEFDHIYHPTTGLLAVQGSKVGLITEGDKVLEVIKYYDRLERINIQDISLTSLQALATPSVNEEPDKNKPKFLNPLYDDPRTADDDPVYEAVADEGFDNIDDSIKEPNPIIYRVNKEFYIAKSDDKYGLIESNNNIRIPLIYDDIEEFGRFVKVRKGNKYGLLTANNGIVVEVTYDAIQMLNKHDHPLNLDILLTKGNQQRLLDKLGNNKAELLDSRIVDDKLERNSDISVIEQNGKYGLFSIKNSKVIAKPNFEGLWEDKSPNTFLALLNGKKVLINKYGKVLIDNLSQYSDITGSEYNDNLLVKTHDGKTGVVTNVGKVLIPPIYDAIEDKKIFDSLSARYEENGHGQVFYTAKQNGLFGVLNSKGEMVVPVVYGVIQVLPYPAYILATKKSDPREGGLGLLDITGKVVVDLKYDGFRMTPYPTGGDGDRVYMINFETNVIDEYDFELNLVDTKSADSLKNTFSLISP